MVYLPLLFLLPVVAIRFARRAPDLAWFTGILFVASLCFYGTVVYWHGDPAFGDHDIYIRLCRC